MEKMHPINININDYKENCNRCYHSVRQGLSECVWTYVSVSVDVCVCGRECVFNGMGC